MTLKEQIAPMLLALDDSMIKPLMDMPFNITCSPRSMTLQCWRREITESEYRTLKRIFGSLQFHDDGNTKDAKAHIKIYDYTINVLIYDALVCEPMEISDDGPTPEQMEQVRKQIVNGTLKVSKCNQGEFLDPDTMCTAPDCREPKGPIGSGLCSNHYESAQADHAERSTNEVPW